MLLLKRAKNGLSHFLLQAHTSSVRAFKNTLLYLSKIGSLILNSVMDSIREYFPTEHLTPWVLLPPPMGRSACFFSSLGAYQCGFHFQKSLSSEFQL